MSRQEAKSFDARAQQKLLFFFCSRWKDVSATCSCRRVSSSSWRFHASFEKPLTELQLNWKEWQQTEEGVRRKEEKRTKAVDLSDKYAVHILLYLEYLKKNFPRTKYLFPSGREVFGERYVLTRKDKHLTGRQILRLIKPLNLTAWMHLFRETKGAEIAKAEGNRLLAVYEVRSTLDLEKEETAYRYVRRYAIQEMKTEK
jgi:hypothetical protein